jgi:pyruvate kinase
MPPTTGEPIGHVRTKIVATLGPASRGPGTLRRLVEAGVDCVRLNFSHGSHEEHAENLARVREAERDAGRPIAVLADLGGPKIRLGAIPGGEVECPIGARFRLVRERSGEDRHELTCTYEGLPDDLKTGHEAIFADGAVAMTVVGSAPGRAELEVTLPGRLRSGQGLNLPGSDLRVEALTEKDRRDLDFLRHHAVEYIGLSFARSAGDVRRLKAELAARGMATRVVAKIEKPQAVADFDAILAESDAVMVARGDLGVEMDVAAVPAIQKRILAACGRARVPAIVATQMLTSMERSSRPTRAEATDVFNAVLDGADAVMLSGETAVGDYPVEAVATMSRILAEAERMLPESRIDPGPVGRPGWISPITEGVVEAASLACRRLGASLLIVATHSGRTALAISKQRNGTPTLALADAPGMARAMALYWGVTPRHAGAIDEAGTALELGLDWARARGLVAPGHRVVLLQGTVPGSPVHNALLVREVE